MQNILCLSGSVGSWKYCCRYVGKIDKNNYCTVSTYAGGILILRADVFTIAIVLLLMKSKNKKYRINATWNLLKGQLSASMKSGIIVLIIQKLSPIWILWWSKKHHWKQNWKVTTESWQSDKHKFLSIWC